MKQTKVLTRRIGLYEPLDIGAYRSWGGFEGLRNALAMTPAEVIARIKRSLLTGRGGAGFSTAAKWFMASSETVTPKYFVCNADEGELGTFKDKVLLDGDPWLVLEGILIACYAIGAQHAYIYIKGEYPDTVDLWENLVSVAKKEGLLGANILGAQLSVDLEVAKGRGIYIAGEEFALISSLECVRVVSRLKPPYPTQKGLFGNPTVVNNVETIANIPVILVETTDVWLSRGTPEEPGTRLFSLSGDVKSPGVYEIELGKASLREVIYEMGNGTLSAKPVKSVQPGGGTTPLLDADSLDCKLTASDIRKAGSNIGTGAVIVYDQTRSALDIVKKLLDYYGLESCGRCAPCRIGSLKMRELVDKLAAGDGDDSDIERIREIANACVKASTCGMGAAFPLPVISAMTLFPHDFQQRVRRTSISDFHPEDLLDDK